MISPVVYDAASEARYTAAPTSSSVFPKRPIGERILNSRPRSVLSSSFAFKSVRKTPGAMALTSTPWRDHSTASDLVSAPTAALLTLYGAPQNGTKRGRAGKFL